MRSRSLVERWGSSTIVSRGRAYDASALPAEVAIKDPVREALLCDERLHGVEIRTTARAATIIATRRCTGTAGAGEVDDGPPGS